jgi:hypothetical protein
MRVRIYTHEDMERMLAHSPVFDLRQENSESFASILREGLVGKKLKLYAPGQKGRWISRALMGDPTPDVEIVNVSITAEGVKFDVFLNKDRPNCIKFSPNLEFAGMPNFSPLTICRASSFVGLYLSYGSREKPYFSRNEFAYMLGEIEE